MATPREIREVAFRVLFQLDAQGPIEEVAPSEEDASLTDRERRRAESAARGAYENREAADASIEVLAPTWPARRQPAVDRAILRLAHYELTVEGVEARVVINEAVELAKRYSTERSPAFINAVLDRIARGSEAPVTEPGPEVPGRVEGEGQESHEGDVDGARGEAGGAA